jgi:hypothetical protein
MYIDDFEWNDSNIEHIGDHGLQDYEVEEVILFGKPIYLKGRDNTYYAYGVTENGRYLFIVFKTKASATIRVITARDMVHKERRYYKERRR